MKKNKRLYYALGIGGIVILPAGISTSVVSFVLEIAELTALRTAMLLRIFGGLGMFVGVVLFAVGIFAYFKGNKALEISETDERNVAIRGRAARATCLISTFLYSAVMIACMVMQLTVVTLLIGGAMIFSAFVQVFLIAYYDKKDRAGAGDDADNEDLNGQL